MRVKDLEQLLRGHLLSVPLVLADDGDLAAADLHRELISFVFPRHQVRLDVGVALAVVPLQAGDQDGVGRRLAHPLAQVAYSRVLNPDTNKKQLLI